MNIAMKAESENAHAKIEAEPVRETIGETKNDDESILKNWLWYVNFVLIEIK